MTRGQANALVMAGTKRLKAFSQERSARQTVENYKKLTDFKKQ